MNVDLQENHMWIFVAEHVKSRSYSDARPTAAGKSRTSENFIFKNYITDQNIQLNGHFWYFKAQMTIIHINKKHDKKSVPLKKDKVLK